MPFDWKYYVTTYSDLLVAGINTPTAAWNHWISYGQHEGRICSQSAGPTRIPMIMPVLPHLKSKLIESIPSYESLNELVDININNDTYTANASIFINFKPDVHKAYGGGNISTYYIQQCLLERFSGFTLIHELTDTRPDIYLVIDPFADKYHKKYGLSDIVRHRNTNNAVGKIVYRVNDCDKTRPTIRKDRSREQKVLGHIEDIDCLIYNSNFIKHNYTDKSQSTIGKMQSVVYNGCDPLLFFPRTHSRTSKKIKIVTHHWSNNMFKGYQMYYDLWKFCNNNPVFEFVFIGNNVPKMFEDVPRIGPYGHSVIGEILNECDIYITASKWDACPNHIIEGIMCGLPILYTNDEGGGKELCNLSDSTIGESFSTFADMIEGLHKIVNNYDKYRQNVLEYRHIFDKQKCCDKYLDVFNAIVYPTIIFSRTFPILNNQTTLAVTFFAKDETFVQILKDDNELIRSFTVLRGEHKLIFSCDKCNSVTIQFRNKTPTQTPTQTQTQTQTQTPTHQNQTSNRNNTDHMRNAGAGISNFYASHDMAAYKFTNRPNKPVTILYCSDRDYYVGMFASMWSLIQNTPPHRLKQMHFSFITPFCDGNTFTNAVKEFIHKTQSNISMSVVYLDETIIPSDVRKSKCVNGGNHLLNLCNFARLMIGEFFAYTNLLYLDSDSIVQHDITHRLETLNLERKLLYAFCANLVGTTNTTSNVLLLKNIIDSSYNWKLLVGYDIDSNTHAFMGAPFYTNCAKWKGVYSMVLTIIREHNCRSEPLYKLFTMSLMNIVFYNKLGHICGENQDGIRTLADLGSTRKTWSEQDLDRADVLDWSGLYKPWYSNGLRQNRWVKYDVMGLASTYNSVADIKKGNVEQFKSSVACYKSIGDNNTNITISDTLTSIKLLSDAHYVQELNTHVHNLLATSNIGMYMSYFIENDADKIYFLNKMFEFNTQFKMIYFVSMDYYMSKMSRVRFLAFENISRNHNTCITYFGPGWPNYNNDWTVQQNLIRMSRGTFPIDFVVWYKPLGDGTMFETNKCLPFPTCIRYNEMWDITHTTSEIDKTKSNLIICHHQNDWVKYADIYKDRSKTVLEYIPHHADPTIFHNTHEDRPIDILISGSLGLRHYPLRCKLNDILTEHQHTWFKDYRIETLIHPGYNCTDAFTSNSLKQYAKYINQSKICIACASKWNYQLGKYIEIPMCGGVICGDVPFELADMYSDFILDVNMDMTDREIADKIISLLKSPERLKSMAKKGEQWAASFTTDIYCDRLMHAMKSYAQTTTCYKKIFIVSDEIRDNHPEFKGQKWICDVLKYEFMKKCPESVTSDPMNADVVWYLAPWNYMYTPPGIKLSTWHAFLKTRDVVCTIHHVDETKISTGGYTKIFEFMEKYGTRYHVLCNSTYDYLYTNLKAHNKPISKHSLWVNTDIFRTLSNKSDIRNKYDIPHDTYCIGSFQKDTEGKSRTAAPKLSKGPDIFVKIVESMHRKNPKTIVILTGLRRDYVIQKLTEKNIPYRYFQMVTLEQINDLYNCLDLYLVSSRVEGGPRAIVEAGFTRTPIISTDVGIASEFLPPESIYDVTNWRSYKDAVPKPEQVWQNVQHLDSNTQIPKLLKYLTG